MLTFKDAKLIGTRACIDKLGKDFFEKHKENSTSAYGDFSDEGVTYCYVGVNDKPFDDTYSGSLILSKRGKKNAIPYSASCLVSLESGEVKFLECSLPKPTY